MIAANFRKFPQALALQMPLQFPHRLTWQTTRPGNRTLRTIRAARAKAFALAGRIAYPIKQTTPEWFRQAAARAKELAASVRARCQRLFAD